MYTQIKQLADEALALQNKDRMDAALRKISAACASATEGVGTASDAAQCEALVSGTGVMSVSLSNDGGLDAKHIPAAELLADQPAAEPVDPEPTPARAKKGGAK